MAYLELQPTPKITPIVLPQTGTLENVNSSQYPLPFEIYADDDEFKQACVEMVSFVWYKLGGNQLDIELDEGQIYTFYQEAALEFNNIVLMHQAKNILSSALGTQKGKFDRYGNLVDEAGYMPPGSHVEMKYPKFDFGFNYKIAQAIGAEVEAGGDRTWHKTWVDLESGKQDYDLQQIIEDRIEDPEDDLYNLIDLTRGGRIRFQIRRVYYKSPRTMWRFYGFMTGGLNLLGNLTNYGMYNDDSTWEVVPAWSQKLQAQIFKDNIYLRTSHYTFRVVNNQLRIMPMPDGVYPSKMWFEFTMPNDIWNDEGAETGINGVNNFNSIPFENIAYEDVSPIGKHWMRNYCLGLAMVALGNIRSKVQNIPFVNGQITLNGDSLIQQGRDMIKDLKETLQKDLEQLTYEKLSETDKNMVNNAKEVMTFPQIIYIT